jgi:choline dehydrogenase-like flavoprotein
LIRFRNRRSFFELFFWNTDAAQKPINLRGIANVRPDLIGKELDEFLNGKARGLSRITAICEALPKIENRIELTSEKDEFGFPLVCINHTFDQDAVGLWSAALDEGVEIAKGAGAKEIWPGRGGIAPQHLLGGTIMGRSASNSVVNSYGQTHELVNLYVAGCGIFPTESSANPRSRSTRCRCAAPNNSQRTGTASPPDPGEHRPDGVDGSENEDHD